MLDRVKEALFSILGPETAGARVLDLFSGSGALGLEALSRGAENCVFVEQDPDLLRLAIANAAKCRLADRCEFIGADVLDLPDGGRRGAPPAGLVLVDPPYAMTDDPNLRSELFDALERMIGTWLETGAVVVLHHWPMPCALWPTSRLAEWDRRVYGRSQLTFFEVSGEGGCD